jgi:hypothetical protein
MTDPDREAYLPPHRDWRRHNRPPADNCDTCGMPLTRWIDRRCRLCPDCLTAQANLIRAKD